MMTILLHLEPCSFPPYYVLVNELDEYAEVTFVQEGAIEIGFEVNK